MSSLETPILLQKIQRSGGKDIYGNRYFRCRGYYADTAGKYEGTVREYIRNQLKDDIANDQTGLKEFTDPFTGEPVKPGK